ncbi:MAG: glycosyltransferase family 9 protein [Candidatus Omnitrophota bacterium]|nr:glycosyltransferase family 9 protein [Candidatus Omnitrophota bacterium]MDZ4243252.1 glycosyltransferase family 9 protein [Candidatus Omnitrophota bacterium]
MENLKNILVVRTDRMGDVVLTTPALRALRKAYPRARLSILVAPSTRELVQGHPDVDEVLLDDRKGRHAGLFGFWKLACELRSRKFDAAIIYHTKKRTNSLCFFAGIPLRTGFRNKKFGFLLTMPLADARHLGLKHEAQYCLDVLQGLGIPGGELSTFIPVQPESEKWADDFFRQEGLDPQKTVALHPGSSDATRQWPVARFAELLDILGEKYGTAAIIIGADNVRPLAEQMRARVRSRTVDLSGRTTVGQMAGVLKRSRVLVSNDSGPVHVADALGTPVISIFTRNQPGINPERWKPLGPKSGIVVTPFLGQKSFGKKDAVESAYLDLVPVSEVLEAVDGIFKLC